MSKADKMFKELGYRKRTEKFLNEIEKEYYEIKDDIQAIVFYHRNKTIDLFGGITIDIILLQAINEKCRELGWIEC